MRIPIIDGYSLPLVCIFLCLQFLQVLKDLAKMPAPTPPGPTESSVAGRQVANVGSNFGAISATMQSSGIVRTSARLKDRPCMPGPEEVTSKVTMTADVFLEGSALRPMGMLPLPHQKQQPGTPPPLESPAPAFLSIAMKENATLHLAQELGTSVENPVPSTAVVGDPLTPRQLPTLQLLRSPQHKRGQQGVLDQRRRASITAATDEPGHGSTLLHKDAQHCSMNGLKNPHPDSCLAQPPIRHSLLVEAGLGFLDTCPPGLAETPRVADASTAGRAAAGGVMEALDSAGAADEDFLPLDFAELERNVISEDVTVLDMDVDNETCGDKSDEDIERCSGHAPNAQPELSVETYATAPLSEGVKALLR